MTCLRLPLLSALLLSAVSILPAQIQFPGQGIPFPRGGGRNKNPNSTDTPSNTRGKKKNDAAVTVITTGMLRRSSNSQLIFEADDHRIITYRINAQTKVQRDSKTVELAAFSAGDHLTVDANQDEEGYFTATAVTFSSVGTAEDRELAARTWDLPDPPSGGEKLDGPKPAKPTNSDDDDGRPTLRRAAGSGNGSSDGDAKSADSKTNAQTASNAPPQSSDNDADLRPKTTAKPQDAPPDADDPGKPQLRRGAPVRRASTTATDDQSASAANSTPGSAREVAVNRPPARDADAIPVEEDPIIVKAKAAAAEYVGTLPNFLARQSTTRYEQENPKEGWQARDVITADVKYEEGTQTYSNIKLGNKSVKSMEEVGGSWSTGEFATLLDSLFDPASAARFKRNGQETLRGHYSYIFKFEIARERSNWRVSTVAQLYYPAYRGTIWIDRETSRVLRLEMETRGVPLLFPIEKVEEAIDYDLVRLAVPEPFLLPTVSEVLSCWHASTVCTRNRIEFRNYRKFGAESDITFEAK